MTNFTMPDPEKVKQTSAKARRAIQEMEIAGLELQAVINILEQQSRQQRLERLKLTLKNDV
ncbi:hypothetical protein ACE1CI_35800 [Aerosakkonemataceae cyanobacterium BLCC-F50]|uniref:Uncharacterized protein n=1 Tax=Floridaenema flaviceps BLCC-F50 TaxID=3153642 RepID=A0ABV4Y306_9CYAN